MTKEEYIQKLIQKEISYLEDNMYRYQLDNTGGKHDKVIEEHKSKLALLK